MAVQKKNRVCGKLCRGACLFAAALCFCACFPFSSLAARADQAQSDELRAVWVTYLDWEAMPADEAGFRSSVVSILERCEELCMNAVIVHVRADADAMYPSNYFPWSRFITGTQGQDPGYDPLQIFIDEARERDIRFYAWINPYRVTGYHNTWDKLSDMHPARIWLSDSDHGNDRWVLKQNGAYYLNPAVPQVRELVTAGVVEIAESYDVDGILFDDYFYPEVDDSNRSRCFDFVEYERSGSALTAAQWRRENVNILLRQVYAAIKDVYPEIEFGVSPEGNLEHLRSDTSFFLDVDTWLSEDGYVDFIMPQIYWGFDQRLENGRTAPFAFERNLESWMRLTELGNIDLYLGLALYKAGTDVRDNNEVSEWLANDDIIRRQVEAGRETGEVSGYAFYSYSSFQAEESRREVENLLSLFAQDQQR